MCQDNLIVNLLKVDLIFQNFQCLFYQEVMIVYKKRNNPVFEILDNVQNPNIYRVYPHKSFCNTIVKDRCVSNDEENIFYQ
jgi:hypothetical protein